MHKIKAFTSRNIKELLRDPLSYIFCLGFPIVMLIVMTLVNESIPKEAGMKVFQISNLSGGIVVFGQTFVMLFTALTVSKDRSGAFLVRMYATPMKSADFIAGYMLPMVVISVCQAVIAYIASFVISVIAGETLNIVGILLAIISSIPSAIMFIGLGLLFGTLFGEKSAPGLCSIVISLGSFLGGIWFDAEATGGVTLKVCKALPFWYATKTVRSATILDFSGNGYFLPLIIVSACALAIVIISSLVFRHKMKADIS